MRGYEKDESRSDLQVAALVMAGKDDLPFQIADCLNSHFYLMAASVEKARVDEGSPVAGGFSTIWKAPERRAPQPVRDCS